MAQTAHVDTFARDNLPPRDQWPEMLFDLPELHYPERLNGAAELLDKNVLLGAGGRPAILTPNGSLTYAQLQEKTNSIARVLVEDLGCVPGNRVLLRGPNNAMLVACWLAVVKAGCIVVTTMPLLRAKELTDVITKARVSVALCDKNLEDELLMAQQRCPDLKRIAYFNAARVTGSLDALASRKPPVFERVDTAAEDVCMIAFTSGTTGVPKGTMHFHRDVLAVCETFSRHVLKPDRDDVFCGTPPLAFTYGLGGALLFPFYAGAAALHLEKTTPETFLGAIAEYGATICFTAPTMYRAMAPLVSRFDIKSLKKCVSAGEPLPTATRESWRAATGITILDGIGSTEMLHIFIAAADDDVRPGATGKAVPGYNATVVDDDCTPLPPGQVGRLAVKGPTGCRYLADERQTTYVQKTWNITGDSYKMDEDGYFWYQARTDDMIISGGHNVAGPEVEFALLGHPGVAEAAVVGVPDDERGNIVKAFVVLREPERAGPEMIKELQDFVKAAIAPYKYPRAIEFVAALPRTETGKLQRFKLRQGPVQV
jgi:2-aminobenzoate-CoA ligase